MRRNAFSWLEMVVILAVIAILAALLFPFFDNRKTAPSRASCQSNLKQIGMGIKQYVQDYDQKSPRYPLVNSSGQGWMGIIMPYLKSTQLFQCPADKSGAIQGKSDYFYNARLSGQQESKLEYIANTIMLGDGVGESASNASLIQFPASWATDQKSPAWRHLEGANYAYADGHVKWLKPEKITNEKATLNNSSFAPW